VLALASAAYGQDGRVHGQVLDPSGAAIPEALVRVVDQRTGTEAKTSTNPSGQYSVLGLSAGLYKIFVQAPRFSTAVSDSITVGAGQDVVLNFTLEVGMTSTQVVVTAEKREESVQEVPIPVSVLSGESLAEENKLLLKDYVSSVPSFTVEPLEFNNTSLAIRGITTGGFTPPTVAITVDGVPYASHAFIQPPNLDPGDLDRVEVLSGPQGTLFGASSMGGLVNYVTKEPSTAGYHGRIEAGTSIVHSQAGYEVRGSANTPLSQTIALRLSGYSYNEPGYIDNPVLNLKGVNGANAYGGQVSGLWQPSDTFSVKLSGIYNRLKTDGSSEVDVPTAGFPQTMGLKGFEQNYVRGIGGQDTTAQVYSGTVKARLWNMNLVSATGFSSWFNGSSFDWSSAFSSDVQAHFGVTGAPFYDFDRYTRVSEEVRLSGTFSKHFEWLAGGFYSHTQGNFHAWLAATDPAIGRTVGIDWNLPYPRTYEQAAVFANLTYHVTNRFDIQVGGRESRDREYQSQFIDSGPYLGPTPVIGAAVESTGNAFTELVAPRFKVSSDVMMYGRISSGYRPGGPNTNAPGLPPKYNPDKTQNYEVGLKSDLLGGKLSIDTSLYYIDWRDIQIQKFSEHNLSFTANGSGAKSEGVELSGTVRPVRGVTIGGWFAFDDAVLTQAFPANSPLHGVPGDRLPLSSRFSGNLSAEYDFALKGSTRGYVGTTVGFIGDRVDIFTATSQRQNLPAYREADLRAGVRNGTWTFDAYANNVSDEFGVISGGLGNVLPFAFNYLRPRTVGLRISKTFAF
jgi:outer membrane receptor protein involved in Fe transport